MSPAMTALEKYSPLLFLLMWSSGAIFVKLGLEDASVSVFLTLRSVGAAFVLFIVCTLLSGKTGLLKRIDLSRHLLLRVIIIGMTLQVGYQSAFFLALHHDLTPGALSILLGIQPILTPLFAREKIGVSGYLYLLLGLSGLTIAILGARETGAMTPLGLIFGTLSLLAISTGSVMQQKLPVDPLVSAFYQSVSAALVFLILLPATPLHLNLTPAFILSAGWMILVVSSGAVLLLFHMLSKHSASTVGILFYLVPVITLMLDYAVFGHSLSWITAAGALLVIIAIRGFSSKRAA